MALWPHSWPSRSEPASSALSHVIFFHLSFTYIGRPSGRRTVSKVIINLYNLYALDFHQLAFFFPYFFFFFGWGVCGTLFWVLLCVFFFTKLKSEFLLFSLQPPPPTIPCFYVIFFFIFCFFFFVFHFFLPVDVCVFFFVNLLVYIFFCAHLALIAHARALSIPLGLATKKMK